jgi:DNA adenine methylase
MELQFIETLKEDIMNPMVKYRGGKSKEITHFIQNMPKEFDTYIEPFLGGGALYFYLEPDKAIISDINSKLIQFYTQLREQYPLARIQLDALQNEYEINQNEYNYLKKLSPDDRVENKNEALYYKMRDMFNGKIPLEYLNSVIYFFINKTAYSGMIRYNSSGEFNVPYGRYANFNTHLINKSHSDLLNRTHIFNDDYSKIFEMATDRDFMFLDPPYDCVFNDYGNTELINGFDEEQHRRLAIDFKNLSCKALLVIGKTELTEELYGSNIVDEYDKSYAVNIRNRFKSVAKHIIVTNY